MGHTTWLFTKRHSKAKKKHDISLWHSSPLYHHRHNLLWSPYQAGLISLYKFSQGPWGLGGREATGGRNARGPPVQRAQVLEPTAKLPVEVLGAPCTNPPQRGSQRLCPFNSDLEQAIATLGASIPTAVKCADPPVLRGGSNQSIWRSWGM